MVNGHLRGKTIGGRCVVGITNNHSATDRDDVLVEGMVDHVHVICGGEGARDTVDRTGK